MYCVRTVGAASALRARLLRSYVPLRRDRVKTCAITIHTSRRTLSQSDKSGISISIIHSGFHYRSMALSGFRQCHQAIFYCKFFDSGAFFSVVFQNTDSAEGNDAAEVGGIFFRHDLILIDDAEGSRCIF